MLRVSSEIAVAIKVRSVGPNPSAAASSRPFWRARITSTSEWTGIDVSRGTSSSAFARGAAAGPLDITARRRSRPTDLPSLARPFRLLVQEGQPFFQVGSAFQPKLGLEGAEGEGGPIKFLKSDTEAESEGSKPILVAGEDAGLDLPYGCREGICHTCVGELCSGRVRDLRNGNVYGQEGEKIRTCISAPEGPVEINL